MNKKKIIILVFLVVVSLVSAGFYGFKVLKKDKQGKPLEVKQEKSSMFAEADKQGQIEAADYAKTQTIDNIKKCNDITVENNAIKCIVQAAFKNSDTSIDICQEIINDKLKKFCLDSFNIKDIIKKQDSKACHSLGEFFQSGCHDTIFNEYSKTSDCSNAEKDDRDRCLDLVNYKQGIATSTKNYCELINNLALKDDCLNIQKQKPADSDADGVIDQIEHSLGLNAFSSDTDSDSLSDGEELYKYYSNPKEKDTDADGLSDKNEVYLGSNPANPDTDGDGNNDGDEVKNGYNPNGPGKLKVINK